MLIKCQLRIECQTRCLCLSNCLTMMSLKISEDGLVYSFYKRISPQLLAYSHSGLNCIFHWKVYCLIRLRSLFKTVAEVSSSYTTVKERYHRQRVKHLNLCYPSGH